MMADLIFKSRICETINSLRNKGKKPTTDTIFTAIKKDLGKCDLDLLKTSLKALVEDNIVENRPRHNDGTGESYYVIQRVSDLMS